MNYGDDLVVNIVLEDVPLCQSLGKGESVEVALGIGTDRRRKHGIVLLAQNQRNEEFRAKYSL